MVCTPLNSLNISIVSMSFSGIQATTSGFGHTGLGNDTRPNNELYGISEKLTQIYEDLILELEGQGKKEIVEHLNALDYNNAIDDKDSIIVDMRNYYESEIGKFNNAIIPNVETSKELLPEVKKILKGKEKKNILLYCTGGIRCEKASSYLIKNGFEKVKQLKGGIIQYAHEVKEKKINSKFIGKNFVFDNRLGERVTEDVISNCHICKTPCDSHTDCNNDACHILFIQCGSCRATYDGCCSKKCQSFNNLPLSEQKKYRKDPNRIVSKTFFDSRIKPKLNN